jgi:mRNA interferase MazF
MICKPFDIAIVPFPFSDHLNQLKLRPALVLSSQKYNQETGCTIFAMITSAKHSEFWGDYKIKNYSDTNLEEGCLVRMKLFTLDNSLIKANIGNLNKSDIKNINKILSEVFPNF